MLSVKGISPTRLNTTSFQTLPNEIGELLAKNLTPRELINLSRISKFYLQMCNHNQLWCGYLKPEAQIGLDLTGYHTAKERFKDLGNRLDRWVPMDARGQQYIRDLCIFIRIDPTIFRLIFRLIESQMLTVLQFACMNFAQISGLKNGWILKDIDDGNFSADIYLAQEDNCLWKVNDPNLEILLERGKLTAMQVISMSDETIARVKFEGIMNYLLDGRMELDQLCNITGNNLLFFGHSGIQKLIDSGDLTVAAVIEMSTEEFLKVTA